MSAADNMKLWHAVEKTDPKAVKPITGKAYQGNSPKPYWLIQKATDIFGPVGIGWGCIVKSERFERIGEIDVLHVAVVSVWYVWEGKRSETFDQMGGTKAAYKANNGKLIVDEDAGKKSVTDGMVKCLSMIGFAGDIFSGRWDDSKYVQEVGQEFREAERETARALEPPRPITAATLPGYMAEAERQLAAITDRDELVAWWKKQEFPMEKVGIGQGDESWSKLRDAWTRRGRAISAEKSAASARSAA